MNKKIILVTGASSGIGAAVSEVLAEEGYKLALLGRNFNRLKSIQSKIKNSDEHFIIEFDLLNLNSIEEILNNVVSGFGVFSGFVHCAGITRTEPLSRLKPDTFNDIITVNSLAAIEIARVLSKRKNKSDQHVSFVFIGSVMSILGEKGNIAYCASKSMLVSTIKAMALELVSKKIRCNIVSPAYVKTEMFESEIKKFGDFFESNITAKHPMGIGSPINVADLVSFLLSVKSEWITGQNFIIDGGYSIQ